MQRTIGATPDPYHPSAEPPHLAKPARARPHAWLALVLLGLILFLVLVLDPSLDEVPFHNALSHVLISADASLLGAALAVLVLRTAYRAGDSRAFLVGMGFLSTASMLIVHYRLSTPGIHLGAPELVADWPPRLSLALGGVFFGFSGLNLSERANRRLMRLAGVGLVLYLVFWLCYSWFFLAVAPFHLPLANAWPKALELARLGIAGLGLACYLFAVRRHVRLYRQSPSQAGLALTCGVALFGEALLTQQIARLYTPSFWLYQIEVAAGFSVIGYAVLRAYHRGQTDEGLFERVFLAGTRARIHADYAQAMEALLTTLARAERPSAALRAQLQTRFCLVESQMDVIEASAAALAQERRQRHDLERLNQRLHEVEQEKTQFMQMLVHDLKNPLGAQVGFLEILQHEPLTEYQRLLLDSALVSGRNLAGMIGDLLDVARMDEGRLEIDRAMVPAGDLLHACADQMHGWLAQAGQTLAVEVEPDLPLLIGDLRLMQRVILNLLSNAIKHTRSGTHIVLRARPAAGSTTAAERVAIEVADDGAGIPTDQLARIFEKFERGAAAALGQRDGAGLGLTFCRKAIEAQGGSIEVESRIGGGTTFRLELPGI
jgi:signal transduction histidine kinase